MIKYRFDLYRFGVKIAELVDVTSFSYTYFFRKPKVAKVKVNANGLPLAIFNAIQFGSELRVFRKGFDDNDFRLIYAGEIRDVQKGNTDIDRKEINFKLYPIEKILEQRYITTTFTTTEEADIIWGIINETQTNTLSGNFTASQTSLDITKGNFINSGNIRSRTYTNDQVFKSLINLVSVKDTSGNPQRLRGFRFSPDFINSSYRVMSYEPEFGIDRNITYISPSIDKFTLEENFEYANHVIAIGKDGITEEAFSTNTLQKNNFRLKTKVITDNSLTTSAEVLELAEEQLAISETFPTFFEFTIPDNDILTGRYRVGDRIRIRYKDDFFDIDTNLTVFQIDVKYNRDNESVKLKVADNEPSQLNTSVTEKLSEFVSNTRNEFYNLSK